MTKVTYEEIQRPDIDEYFLKIAAVVAERSTCLRRHIGAVAVKNKHILATGYNGAPSGLTDCLTLGCIRNELKIPSGQHHEICRAVHAEQNVIIQAALHGISLEGSTIYCTTAPCILCKKMLINAKIKRFVTYAQYDKSSYEAFVNFRVTTVTDMFEEAGITVDIKPKPSNVIDLYEHVMVPSKPKHRSKRTTQKKQSRVTRKIDMNQNSNQRLPM